MRRHYASRGRSRGRGQGTISQTLFRRLLYLNRLYSIDWCCRCETHWTPLKMVKEVSFFLVFGWKNRERRETELGWFFFSFSSSPPKLFFRDRCHGGSKGKKHLLSLSLLCFSSLIAQSGRNCSCYNTFFFKFSDGKLGLASTSIFFFPFIRDSFKPSSSSHVVC